MDDERGVGRREASPRGPRPTRRTVLAAAGVTVGLAAGCTDAGPGGDEESNVADPETVEENETTDEGGAEAEDANEGRTGSEAETENGSDGESEAETEEETDEETGNETEGEAEEAGSTALDHPSARNTSHSPVLGPEPTEAEATVVMFDDPSCPACAYFEENVFPDLRTRADEGELSIVWRGIPVIEEWSGAALQVLWATYERDVDAFWDLRAHAFEVQDSIDGDAAAVDRLIDHLAETTSLDGEAIRSEAEEAAYERRVDLDEDAAARAGLDATPYFFLFRDGEFRTEVRGAEDYRVFENALEL